MRGLNRVQIMGNLGADPEMRYTPTGRAMTRFSVAVNRRWKNSDGEPQEEVTWFRVSAWNGTAEVCASYLTKGRLVLVEGRLNPDENGGPRIWTDQDGNPRASFELTAIEVKFLGPRPDGDADSPAITDEEIPF